MIYSSPALSINFQFTIIIDLFTPRLRGRCLNFQLTLIIDWLTPHLWGRKCKYLLTPRLSGEGCIFSIHNDNRCIQCQFCMIIYYITHPSCRGELHKYVILNDTNFYLSLTGEKDGFVLLRLRLGLELGLWIWCLYYQTYLDRIQFRTGFRNGFGLTGANNLPGSIANYVGTYLFLSKSPMQLARGALLDSRPFRSSSDLVLAFSFILIKFWLSKKIQKNSTPLITPMIMLV